MQHIQMNLMM